MLSKSFGQPHSISRLCRQSSSTHRENSREFGLHVYEYVQTANALSCLQDALNRMMSEVLAPWTRNVPPQEHDD